jgi:hypothetical protein
MSNKAKRKEAMEWLITTGIVPYWNSIDSKVLFKKVAKEGPSLSLDKVEKAWPLVLEALEINTEADAAHLRTNVEHILKERGRM